MDDKETDNDRTRRDRAVWGRVAIVGVGLIGGSIARALRTRSLAQEVIGVGRDPSRLAKARDWGVIDTARGTSDSLEDVDLVVVCTPVDRIAEDLGKVLSRSGADTIVTDAGSTKQRLVEAIENSHPQVTRFVGSHPIAGSHLTGFEHADPRLFESRMCIVTPGRWTSPQTVTEVESFWRSVGMSVRRMSPAEHDRILALTSHLPHLVAAALAQLVDESSVTFAATGFRDTTRVAGGSPDLWTAIFDANREQMLETIDLFLSGVQRMRGLIAQRELTGLCEQLTDAQTRRRLYDLCHGPPAATPTEIQE